MDSFAVNFRSTGIKGDVRVNCPILNSYDWNAKRGPKLELSGINFNAGKTVHGNRGFFHLLSGSDTSLTRNNN